MQITNYLEAMSALQRDEVAGTQIARLTGDDGCSLFLVELAGGTVLPAHYHWDGIEIYQMLSGEGEISLGRLDGGRVVWLEQATLKAGDCLSIEAGTVHRLANAGTGSLHLLCSTPPAHLGGDRFFVTD